MAAPSLDGGTGFEDDAKQSHNAAVNRESTGRDRTPLLSTQMHDDAGHATAGSVLGVLDVQPHLRIQPGRVRRSLSGPGNEAVGTHAELLAPVQSHTGEARDQRRGGRIRDLCTAVTRTD